MDSFVERLGRRIGIRHEPVRCFLAELFGTFMLTLLIDGSVAQTVLTKSTKNVTLKDLNGTTIGTFEQSQEGLNVFLSIQLAHLVGLAFGIFVSGGVSGGHINPAVTLAMAIIGRLPWSRVPFYILGQMIGGFLSAPVIYGVYYEAIAANELGAMGIWATGPYEFTTTGMAIGCSIIATFILVTAIMAVTDQKNMPAPPAMIPIVVGLAAMASGLGYGFNGFALNPARDFGPRIFESFLSGIGSTTFRKRHLVPYFFWIPALIPFLGAILAALVYILLVELHHPRDYTVGGTEDDKDSESSNNSTTKI